MTFTETPLPGVFVIDATPHEDDRGFFARSYCAHEFEAHGLNSAVVQCNVSYNRSRGTLRGMHYQEPPAAEAKLVRCLHGALYDVVVDIRPDSPTFRRWTAVELRGDAGRAPRMLFVPEGFAHGFLTLEDHTEVLYQMSAFYAPSAARGFRWNDPAFAVTWPEAVQVISERDRTYPDFPVAAPSPAVTR
jgi:dTDP-4-dehydrorhamnose 3,5-epimerase